MTELNEFISAWGNIIAVFLSVLFGGIATAVGFVFSRIFRYIDDIKNRVRELEKKVF